MMNKKETIYVAGHRGLVGSALIENLKSKGYSNIVTRTHDELDLTNQTATREFFENEKPDYVFLAAAKVGGIQANNIYPAEFIRINLQIQTNVIESAYINGVKRLLFLGSSCIYPRDCNQPIKEDYLLTGQLEPTNRPYALAKIAGIEMCWSYNRQYNTEYMAVMPTNLYGPNDNYDLNNSHVIPAIIRKMHEAKCEKKESVQVWGTGKPKREFMYNDDMASACIHIMNLDAKEISRFIDSSTSPPLINVGCGKDVSIKELAELIKDVVGFKGDIQFDITKPDGTPQKLLDVGKLKLLGWEYNVELKDGLDMTYKHFIDSLS